MMWQRLQVQEDQSVPTMATVPQKTLSEENTDMSQLNMLILLTLQQCASCAMAVLC